MYTLRQHARFKHLRLTVFPDGRIVVSGPQNLSVEKINRFVAEKQDWIKRSLNKFACRTVSPHKIKSSRTEYKKYKEIARDIVTRKILYWNKYYGFTVGNISIKNQKTRWGSCSRKGNININYKIALLPDHLADYLIVHELCHIGQFNHSQRFWDLVAKTIPDYVDKVKELKMY